MVESQKKSKKSKRKEKDEGEEKFVVDTVAAEEERKTETTKTKKNKRAAKDIHASPENPDNDNGEQKELEDAPKKEKKKKKRKAEDVAADEPTVAESEAKTSKKKKSQATAEVVNDTESGVEKNWKKSKKRKNQDDVQDEGGGFEVVPLEKDDHDVGIKKRTKKEGSNGEAKTTWTYKEHPELQRMSESDISAALQENKVTLVDGSEGPKVKPITKFEFAGLPVELTKALSLYDRPTPVQMVTWPYLFMKRDVVGIAKTGSGKVRLFSVIILARNLIRSLQTLAFGIPALIHILNHRATHGSIPSGALVLVVAPTRELAQQIQDQLHQFGSAINPPVKSVCLFGGVPKDPQIQSLKRKTDIIVATPGRLIDLVNQGVCDLSSVNFIVLDEADRMLETNFEDDIKKILSHVGKNRQTVMFSATWPPAIQKLSASYLRQPVRATVGDTELAANSDVSQDVVVCQDHEKTPKLLDLLERVHAHKKKQQKILVFVLYKNEVDTVERVLTGRGYKVLGIRGDMTQAQRDSTIEKFRAGEVKLLVTTDVLGRGFDVPDVEVVINYTYPLTTEEYCHRIGRTGRAGRTGISHTLFTVRDKKESGALINVLKKANQKVPAELLKFGGTVKRKVDSNYGAFVKDVDMTAKPKKIVFD
ncbi:P-loop containing nucleoside triphosphate hydrolase protein [Cladochytrium replicatum]|nr:P-loop containing nucleoside triphosphate hydrolase protein [Cladochytrium replicatum]